MLDKIKLMNLDPEAYYRWIETNEKVSVDYSDGERTLDSLNDKEGGDRRLYELSVMGEKMMQALIMAENLSAWSFEGPYYEPLGKILDEVKSLAARLLQAIERSLDGVPEETFSEDDGEFNAGVRETQKISSELRIVYEKLRLIVIIQEKFHELIDNE